MSYPKRLARIRPRRGIASDVPAWTVGPDALTSGANVVFRQGIAERAPSTVAVYDPPSVAPLALLNIQIAGVNYWIYAGASATYAVQGSTHTDISHASGLTTIASIKDISLFSLNGVPIFNNGTDEPMYWDGNVANNFVDLPDWTATESCDFIVPHRYHLFAFGIDGPSGDFPQQLKWSDAAEPGAVPASWTSSAANEAGDNILSDTPGGFTSAANLRASLAIYKTGSTHLADYVGGNEVFAFRTAFAQAGAVCRHAVADINGRHLVVTDGDIIIHDGQNIQSIAQDRRKRALFNSLDSDNFENLFCVYHRQQNEVWICFPESGSTTCSRAMIYDVKHDSWGDRELTGITFAAPGIISDTTPDETFDAQTYTYDSAEAQRIYNKQTYSAAVEELVLADFSTPDFLEVGRGSESLTSTIAKSDMDFGEPERVKFVKRVHLQVECATSVDFSVRVGTRDAVGESITWTAPVMVNSNDGYADVLAMGKFISVEVATTTDQAFKITGLDLEAEQRGYF